MKALSLTEEAYRDRVLGGWRGAVAGVTLGTPIRGRRVPSSGAYYSPVPGQPAASPMLDLLTVWLKAAEEAGTETGSDTLSAALLREMNLHDDEFGYAKLNLLRGFRAPASGALSNWFRHSTGAFTRSLFWALLCPGAPQAAAALAYRDATIDHCEDGVWAPMALAAMGSAAFFISEAMPLLTIGLAMIPRNCRTARAIKIAMATAARGASWLESRESVQKEFGVSNYSDAALSMGFLTVGLLHGLRDFGGSLTAAVNCGYDTEAVGGALGGLLGIAYGGSLLPSEWTAPLRDILIPSLASDSNVPVMKLTDLADRTAALGLRFIERYSPDLEIMTAASASTAPPGASFDISTDATGVPVPHEAGAPLPTAPLPGEAAALVADASPSSAASPAATPPAANRLDFAASIPSPTPKAADWSDFSTSAPLLGEVAGPVADASPSSSASPAATPQATNPPDFSPGIPSTAQSASNRPDLSAAAPTTDASPSSSAVASRTLPSAEQPDLSAAAPSSDDSVAPSPAVASKTQSSAEQPDLSAVAPSTDGSAAPSPAVPLAADSTATVADASSSSSGKVAAPSSDAALRSPAIPSATQPVTEQPDLSAVAPLPGEAAAPVAAVSDAVPDPLSATAFLAAQPVDLSGQTGSTVLPNGLLPGQNGAPTDILSAVAWADNTQVKPLLVTPSFAVTKQAGGFEAHMEDTGAPVIGYNMLRPVTVTIYNHGTDAFSGMISLAAPSEWSVVTPAALGQKQYISGQGGGLRVEFSVLVREGAARIEITNALRLRLLPDGGVPETAFDFVLAGMACWRIAGPFANFDGEGYDRVYGPEERPGTNELYANRLGQAQGWAKCAFPESVMDLEGSFKASSGVCYGQTLLRAPAAVPARLTASTNSGIKVWLNGRLILRRFNREPFRPMLGDPNWSVDVDLIAGDNAVMVKWVRGNEPYEFSLTVCGRRGEPMPAIGNTGG